MHNLGELLKNLRRRQKINQQYLAERLGVHRNTIGKWERGICLPDSRGMVLELARCLRLDENETGQLLEASLTGPALYWHVPYQRNPFFTGRDAFLLTLHNRLCPTSPGIPSQFLAVSGLGGIGKTEVVLEYAYRYALEYRAIFWFSAGTHATLTSSFLALGKYLQLSEGEKEDSQAVIDTVLHWLEMHRDWLLIFDQVEDLAVMNTFLPRSRQGTVLITTHLHSLDGLAQVLTLPPFTSEESCLFLLLRTGLIGEICPFENVPDEYKESAHMVVEAMEGLPLALDQAGSCIYENRYSICEFYHLFLSCPSKILQERSAHARHPSPLSQTLMLAIEQVRSQNPLAIELLICCAFLAADEIPESLFLFSSCHLGPVLQELLADVWRYHAAVKDLLTYSLIQRCAETQTLRVHRLVQIVLRDALPLETQREWSKRLLQAIDSTFPSHRLPCLTLEQLEWSRKLLPHARACVNDRETSPQAMRSLLVKLANYLLHYQGQLAEALPLLQRALTLYEGELRPDHAEIAFILSDLGLLYCEQAQYTEAEPFFQSALTLCEQKLGPAHPDTAQSLNNLALLYSCQGRYTEAEPLFQRSLSVYIQALGACHLRTSIPLRNLAMLFLCQEKYLLAEPLLQRTLAICEQSLGPSHPWVSMHLHNLASAYHSQKKYEEAEQLYQRALTIREQTLGPMHHSTAASLESLARLYHDIGREEEAEPLYHRALLARQQRLGPAHPDILKSLRHLEKLYSDQERWIEAEFCYRHTCSFKDPPFRLFFSFRRYKLASVSCQKV